MNPIPWRRLPLAFCRHHDPVSPHNHSCGWCRKFGIHVDRRRNLCRRCQADPKFQSALATTCLAGEDAGATYCERYVRAVTPEVCARCKAEPEYQAFLAGQRDARRTEAMRLRRQGCRHRTFLREEERPCCGGKTRAVAVYRCGIRKAELVIGPCLNCEAWEA